jgi:competence protein ComGC
LKTVRPQSRAIIAHPLRRVAGFTIVEMMVSLSIIALMIALMVPLLGRTKEAANRLMCASNLRQIGVGLSLYGSNHRDRLPSTVFARGASPQPQEMITLTTGAREDEDEQADWDGLGWLIGDGRMFVDSPMVLFCPSHRGSHRPEFAAKDLASHNVFQRIYINYHFIGDLDRERDRMRRLDTDPNQAIVADGMRELSDVNHVDGANVLRGDCSVSYWADRHSLIYRSLTTVSFDAVDPGPVYWALWAELSRVKD